MRKKPIVIGTGQTLSAGVRLGAQKIVGIEMPALFTGVALTFQASNDGGVTFLDVYDEAGVALSITCAPSRVITFKADLISRFECVSELKVRSGAAETPARTINLLVEDPK